jgi:prophage regulatory protein
MSEKHQRLLRLAEVRDRVPYSRSTIYQLVAEGKFPKPISLGARAVAWLESEIDQWIASRIDKGRAEVTDTRMLRNVKVAARGR